MRRPILLAMTVAAAVALGACSSSSTPAPASAAPGSSAPAASTPASAPAESASAGASSSAVTIQNFAFGPATITVSAGASVTWTNQDSVGHTVTFDQGGNTSDTLATGATYSQTFATAGTFTYHCKIHPSMKGTVQVNA